MNLCIEKTQDTSIQSIFSLKLSSKKILMNRFHILIIDILDMILLLSFSQFTKLMHELNLFQISIFNENKYG